MAPYRSIYQNLVKVGPYLTFLKKPMVRDTIPLVAGTSLHLPSGHSDPAHATLTLTKQPHIRHCLVDLIYWSQVWHLETRLNRS